MLTTFTQEIATVSMEMFEEIDTLHETTTPSGITRYAVLVERCK